jgi:hypothetical protein
MCGLLLFGFALMNNHAALDASRILAAQQSQAMEVRAQHREVTKGQPESYLTPEEEREHVKLKEPS